MTYNKYLFTLLLSLKFLVVEKDCLGGQETTLIFWILLKVVTANKIKSSSLP